MNKRIIRRKYFDMTTFDEQNHIIYIRKILNEYKSKATANAKSDTCYLCQKKSSSFVSGK